MTDGVTHRLPRPWLAPVAILLVAIAALALAPVGYVGGGGDDYRYLEAARCWVAHGPCLPHTHWDTRWPAILPIALSSLTFGESRLTVGLGPLLAWAACLALIYALGRAWFDRAVGAGAAMLLASTPVFTHAALQPGADNLELAFQLGALLAATAAHSRQSRPLAALGGVLAALAVQTRDTSLVFCGVAALGWLLLDADRRRVLLWALAGFAGVLVVELAVYAAVAGDPLLRYRLAMGHAAFPTDVLAASVDTSRSPLFNADYIAGWKREAGIHFWWLLDPWIDLVVSRRVGWLLIGAIVMIPAFWFTLRTVEKRRVGTLLVLALLVAAGLIYALAVDPKPRMLLSAIAAAAMAMAAMTAASWREGKGAVPAVGWGLIVVMGLYSLSRTPTTHAMERRASSWIDERGPAIEIDEKARAAVALVPAARGLAPAGTGRPLRIAVTVEGCETFGVPVVDRAGERQSGELCLLRMPNSR